MAAPILLIHGAWHGAWCWERVLPLLGPEACAIDLPGHGPGRPRPGWGVGLDAYARAVCEAARDMGGRVAVAGHSMGGMVISRAAEMEPALFAGLIYVCAFLPRAGDSLLSLGGEITGSQVPSVMKRHTLAGVTTIDGARAKPVFYGDCIDEDAAACAARLVPQSLPPFLARIRVSRDAFGLSRRFYIACTRDNAIPMALQERMIERVGVEDHVSFDTSHSPFLSRPDDTADQIRAFAQRL